MGTANRNPGQIVGLSCDSANVAAYAVLVQGASNDSVKLPSGAGSREKLIGVAYEAGSATANRPISVVINGIMPMLASGSITRGDRLVIASSAGAVSSESSTTAPDATRVGIAQESVADGEYVSVLIGHTAGSSRGTVIPMTASGAITANTIVVAGFGGGVVATAPGGADPTTGVLGVALNTAADTETVYVQTSGIALVTDSGSGVTLKDFIAVAGTNGKGKTAAPSTGTNNHVVGVALATASAGASITVMVQPQRIQG